MHRRASSCLPFILRLGLFELLFLTPLVFYGWATTFSMTKETFAQLGCLIILCGWTVELVREKSKFLFSAFTLPAVLFGLVLLSSLLWTESTYLSFLGLGVWGCFFLVYFFSQWVMEDEGWMRLLLIAVLLSGFLAAGYSILQFYGIELPIWRRISGRMRLFSTFGNPNYLAGYLTGVLPLGVLLYFSEKRWKVLYLTLVAVLYTSLLMTNTRGAWVALFFSSILAIILILIFLGREFFRTRKFSIILLVVVFIFITLVFSFPNPLNFKRVNVVERGISTLNFTSSASQRLLIWQVAGELIRERPILGWGVGTFGLHYPEAQGIFLSRKEGRFYIPRANRSIHAHNDYLELWMETGLVGLFIFFWILVSFYKRVLLFLKKNRFSEPLSLFLIFLTAGVTSFLVHAGVSFPFHIVQNGMVFWLFLAMSGKIIQKEPQQLNSSKTHSSKGQKKGENQKNLNVDLGRGATYVNHLIKWTITVLVVTSALYLASWRIRIFISDLYVKQAELLMESKVYPEAKDELIRAIKINPYNAQAFAYVTRVDVYLGLYQEIINVFAKAEKGWNTPMIHNYRAFAYLNQGRMNKAKEALKKGIFLYPNFAAGYINLGYINLLEAEKKLEEGGLFLAEEKLNQAFLSYTQAKIWQSEFNFPLRVSETYFKLAKEKEKLNEPVPLLREVSPPFFFYTHQDYFLTLLPPLVKEGKPFSGKLLIFENRQKISSEIRSTYKVKVEILDDKERLVEEKIFEELKLGEAPCILNFSLEKGLASGDYFVSAGLFLGEKELTRERQKILIFS